MFCLSLSSDVLIFFLKSPCGHYASWSQQMGNTQCKRSQNVYPGAGAWVHKCVPRRRGLRSPGAGAWVHIMYTGAGAWVHILAPFALSVTRLSTL